MSYPLSLDEMTEESLVAEIARRGRLRRAGKCDYCERPYSAEPCKMEERHDTRFVPPVAASHNETRAWAKVEECAKEINELRKRMTFGGLREANFARLSAFKNNKGVTAHEKPDGSDWSLLEWSGAMGGEVGEAAEAFLRFVAAAGKASNVAKKLKRGDLDAADATDREQLADEIADVVIYGDILARRAGIDLGEAVRRKWNKTSAKIGYEGQL